MPTERQLPNQILSFEDAESLVDWCIDVIGLGYHPDTRAADYTTSSGTPLFTAAIADALDRLHDESFSAGFSESMYECGLHRFHNLMAQSGRAEF